MQSSGLDKVLVEVAEQPHPQLISLVQATTFGTEGLQYRRLDVQSQIDRFAEATFFHALSDDKLVGVYILDKRHLQIDGQVLTGYYRGVLAVATHYQGAGVGKYLTSAARTWMSKQAAQRPIVSFGCIDQSNARSLNLLQSGGATSLASLSMYMMYRQWPRRCCELVSLESVPTEKLRLAADETYADCRLRDVSASKQSGFVLHDDGGVAICACASVTSFQITAMGSVATRCTRLFVVPFLPARKRFDPDCFRYVSFSNVTIRRGCEKLWPRFVSSVLAHHQCHFGAVFVDPHSCLFARLQKAQFLPRFFPASQGSISVVWQAFSDSSTDTESLIRNGSATPVHLWPIDA